MPQTPYRCDTPIAFFLFNRPEFTARVLTQIAKVAPRRLLLIADGARTSVGEEQRCAEARAIACAVTWPCKVQTNFSSVNMGCRARLISGLDWVFTQTDEAIVLEDDVLPDISFFQFCDEMLCRYREDGRVAMVTGFNIVEDMTHTPDSYFFSQLTHVWGWATWARAWKRYDPELRSWPAVKATGLMEELFPKLDHRLYWTRVFDEMHAGTGPNTWDLQWFYTNLTQYGLSVTPGVNLIDNIGFGPGATHTIHMADAPRVKVGTLKFPLRHPPAMVPLRSLDVVDQNRSHCRIPGFTRRVMNKIRRTLHSH